MNSDARRSLRRAIRTKYAAGSKRGVRPRRSVRIARLEAELLPGVKAAAVQLTATVTPRRPIARWVLLLGVVPLLLIGVVGASLINVVVHTERATGKIVQPPLQRGADGLEPHVTGAANAPGAAAPLPTALPSLARKEPFTFLLVGVDAREGDTQSQSDTVILVYIDPSEKSAHLLSIPRDLYVTMPAGLGQAKVADVYAIGQARKYGDPKNSGVALVRDVIEQNFRVRIDFFAQVDFNGFRKIVDTVGGVTVDNPYPVKDDEYPTEDYQFTRVFFPAGIMHLSGEEALRYARTRHDDSDYGRNARQQQVILAVRQQGISLDLLSQSTKLIDTLGDSVRTDFQSDQWASLAKLGAEMRGNAITQFSLVSYITNSNTSAGFYSFVDWAKVGEYMKQFSPKENKDALRSQTQPGTNLNAKIVVENGTRNGGLANRWATTLGQQGYMRTSFIDAPANVKGTVRTAKVYALHGDEQTARAIAQTLNLKPERVQTTTKRPPEAPSDLPGDTDILVVLGDDVLEPG